MIWLWQRSLGNLEILTYIHRIPQRHNLQQYDLSILWPIKWTIPKSILSDLSKAFDTLELWNITLCFIN